MCFSALKIHISSSTFSELGRRGGFEMESRGPVQIKVFFPFSFFLFLCKGYFFKYDRCFAPPTLYKVLWMLSLWLIQTSAETIIFPQGKGTLHTYWLNGKVGFRCRKRKTVSGGLNLHLWSRDGYFKMVGATCVMKKNLSSSERRVLSSSGEVNYERSSVAVRQEATRSWSTQPDKRVEGGAARCLQRSKLFRIASRNFVTSLFIACLVLFLKTHSSWNARTGCGWS